MRPITLLDVDQMPSAMRLTLAAIMACYSATLIAAYPDGAMHIVVDMTLVEAFLIHVARDVVAVVCEDFALVV